MHAPTADDLDCFIRAAKGRDVPDDALVALLRQNGWSERRIYGRLTAYYGESLGIAPPVRSSRGARRLRYAVINFLPVEK